MTRVIDHGPDKGTDTFHWDPTGPVESSYDGTDPSPAGAFTGAHGRPMRHPSDGRLHFSELKAHAKSPAHVRLACTHAKDMTEAMMIGGCADSIVFGQKGCAVYPGKVRNGKEWELFKAEHPSQYLPSVSEYKRAEGAALAVRADPVAQSALAGCEFQMVAQWERDGLPCAAGIAGERGGFDAIREAIRDAPPTGWGIDPAAIDRVRRGYIADLKITSSVEPRELQRHAWKMYWVAQAAWYLDGARAMGLDVTDFYLIAAEAQPPHCVTVMRMSEAALEAGRKQIAGWIERHRQCEAAGVWPGFTQSVVELEPEAWMVELELVT